MDLSAGLAAKYVEDKDKFDVYEVEVGSRPALLMIGAMVSEVARWAGTVQSLTGTPVNEGSRTAAAALLIRDEPSTAWAITFGMGHFLLEPSCVDQGFGQRVAIRSADAGELTSVSRTTLDQRPRVDRLSIPTGEHVRNFGLGDVGELVTRLVGKANIEGPTYGDKSFSIRGADALSAPLGWRPDALLSDLDALSTMLARPAVPELAPLEQLVALKRRDPRIPELRARLARALGEPDAPVGLAWPTDRADDHAPVSSFNLSAAGSGFSGEYDGMVTLEHLLTPVRELPENRRLGRLEAMKVLLLSDAEEPASSAIPALYWLAYETTLKGSRFCLHSGRWYLMDQDYAQRLAASVEAIFARQAPVVLPSWPASYKDEEEYNRKAAEAIGGLKLDRELAHTDAHRRGIEICDILGPNGELIHVKKTDRSSSASHLLAQALVSAEAMLHDEQARHAFEERVIAAGGTADNVPQPVRSVVIGMAREKPLDPARLFTFTQVTLVRGAAVLQRNGVDVFVAPILLGA